VAILAATGSSNRTIARTLSVTISTVEQHLTRTYKKLGFNGRRELRAKLG
jgi:DNA-binding CsgD family transcriptional regulator